MSVGQGRQDVRVKNDTKKESLKSRWKGRRSVPRLWMDFQNPIRLGSLGISSFLVDRSCRVYVVF